ncbi:MAG: efflux RND transporter periplasmic adaptor subunit [Verrucomicrobiales bacterium]
MSSPTEDPAIELSDEPPDRPGAAALVVRLILPLVLLGLGAGGYVWLAKKPPPPDVPAAVRRAVEVRVSPLERVDYQIRVATQGAIQPHSEVGLTSQLNGRIQSIEPKFEIGAFFSEGDILLELDPVDFQVALVNARAQVAQAKFNLEQEVVRAKQAELNWEDLGYEEEPSDLVLRIPHVKVAEQQWELAKTQLTSAERDLERSQIRAPFDGRVLARGVGLGQTVGGTTELGTIIATDYSEVRLPISTRFLGDLTLPEDVTDPPLEITLRDALSETSEIRWEARILRTEGALDTSTLELFAVARIEDPFGLTTSKVPLRIGQPVAAEIPGRKLEGVFVIPREAVTGLDRIRLVDPESLTLGTAVIKQLWADEEHLVFRDPAIEDGTLLSLTRLVYAPDGGEVVIEEDELSDEVEEQQ